MNAKGLFPVSDSFWSSLNFSSLISLEHVKNFTISETFGRNQVEESREMPMKEYRQLLKLKIIGVKT